MHIDQFRKSDFLDGLAQLGAVLLEPTNDYEVVRYYLNDSVHVVYRNKRGRITWTGESDNHYHLLVDGHQAPGNQRRASQ